MNTRDGKYLSQVTHSTYVRCLTSVTCLKSQLGLNRDQLWKSPFLLVKSLSDNNCYIFSCKDATMTKFWSKNFGIKVIWVKGKNLVDDIKAKNDDIITHFLQYGYFNGLRVEILLFADINNLFCYLITINLKQLLKIPWTTEQ